MKKVWITIWVLCFYMCAGAQVNKAAVTREIKDFQDGLNAEYKGDNSPLPAGKRKGFKGIQFFPINMQYVVTAHFSRTPNEKPFGIPGSGGAAQEYVKYGRVEFTLLGKEYSLVVYQSPSLAKTEQYKDYLAIFFKDKTSGKETYGGGRYIDLAIPKGDTITINFNKAYHPYCACAEGYNCPIPPAENFLPVRMEAGVRL